MPLIRVSLPEGIINEKKAEIRKKIKNAVLKTLAPKEIKYDYVSIISANGEIGDGLPVVDIDLRPGIKLDINGQNIELNEDYMSQKTERRSEMVYPNVVEPSFGLDRILYCLLESSWNVDGEREWISLPQDTSPYDLLVAPLMTKDGLDDRAHEIMKAAINVGVDAYYDEAGSIGRRYARADEIGIFYSMTIDHQTLEDGTITLRERDSKNQSRVSLEDALSQVRR